MARSKAKEATQHDNVNEAALEKAAEAMVQVSQNAAAAADMIGYDAPYSEERLIQEIRFYLGQSAEAMLEAGRRLLVIKESADHGRFVEIVENDLGMAYRTAAQVMQAAVKYLKNPALNSNVRALAHLGKAKLFDLMAMDDDVLVEIAEGGTINGLNLDTIDHMTTRELKAALREQIATAEANDKVLAIKNKKLDQVTAQLERKKAEMPPEEWNWAPHRNALLQIGEEIVNCAQTEFRRAMIDIREMGESEGGVPADIEALQGQVLSAVMQTLVVIQNDYGIAVDLESIVVPAWAQEDESKKK